MNELNAFLLEETNQALESVQKYKEKIRSLNYDIEFVDKTADKMNNSKDKTKDIFSVVDNSETFDSLEYKNLLEQKNKLMAIKKEYELELKNSENRYNRLKKIAEELDVYIDESDKYINNKHVRIDELKKNEEKISLVAALLEDKTLRNFEAVKSKNKLISNIIKSDQQRAMMELDNNNLIINKSIEDISHLIDELIIYDSNKESFEDAFYRMMNPALKLHNIQVKYSIKQDYSLEANVDHIFLISMLKMIKAIYNDILREENIKCLGIHILFEKNIFNILIRSDKEIIRYDNILLNNVIVNDTISLFNGKIDKRQNDDNDELVIKFSIKKD